MTAETVSGALGKFAAAEYAVDLVQDGMRLGLGSGSTAEIFIDLLAARISETGISVSAVASSGRSADIARRAGMELCDLSDLGSLDLTVDGADEIDPDLDLIKGGGGALLREKIVAAASDEMIVIADTGKWVASLGKFPVPVEVDTFGWAATSRKISELLKTLGYSDCQLDLRTEGRAPFVTDGGNHVIDVILGRIEDPQELARALNAIPGVVESGIFFGLCRLAVLGRPNGKVDVHSRNSGRRACVHDV